MGQEGSTAACGGLACQGNHGDCVCSLCVLCVFVMCNGGIQMFVVY